MKIYHTILLLLSAAFVSCTSTRSETKPPPAVVNTAPVATPPGRPLTAAEKLLARIQANTAISTADKQKATQLSDAALRAKVYMETLKKTLAPDDVKVEKILVGTQAGDQLFAHLREVKTLARSCASGNDSSAAQVAQVLIFLEKQPDNEPLEIAWFDNVPPQAVTAVFVKFEDDCEQLAIAGLEGILAAADGK